MSLATERALPQAGVAQSGTEAELVGDLMECEKEAEDESAGRLGAWVVEVAAEGAAESFHASGMPLREVGEGTLLDLVVLTEGLAEEDGGWGVTVRDGLNIHGKSIKRLNKYKYNIYMGT